MFQKAEREKIYLKIAMTGTSGSGKSYSSLLIANGLAGEGKIAMVDTENGSGSCRADHGTGPDRDNGRARIRRRVPGGHANRGGTAPSGFYYRCFSLPEFAE